MAQDQELADFVREHVASVWALEMLLAMRRDRARCWAPDELVRELRASQTLVTDNLQRLQRSGLAMPDDAGCYRYAPATAWLDELCAKLEAHYKEKPVATINMIAAPRDPLQSLADAFKFRGGPK